MRLRPGIIFAFLTGAVSPLALGSVVTAQGGSPMAPPQDVPSFELEEAGWLEGRVSFRGRERLPSPLTMTVLGYFPGSDAAAAEARSRRELDPSWEMREYVRGTVSVDGQFSFPRHPRAAAIRVVLKGNWFEVVDVTAEPPPAAGELESLLGFRTLEFVVGTRMDPRGLPITIEVDAASDVTLQLGLEGIAKEDEIAGLVGAEILFEGHVRGVIDGQPWRRIGRVEAGGVIRLGRMLATEWRHSRFKTSSWKPAEPFESAEDLLPFRVRSPFSFTVEGGRDLRVRVPMERVLVVFGEVTGPNGRPVAGAKVRLESQSERDWLAGRTLESDATGAFTFPNAPRMVDRCAVEAAGFADTAVGLLGLRRAIASGKALQITLEPCSALRATLRLEDGTPLPEIGVHARPEGSGARWLTAITNADGVALFEGLPPATYLLKASAASTESPHHRRGSETRWLDTWGSMSGSSSATSPEGPSRVIGEVRIDTRGSSAVDVVCRPAPRIAGAVSSEAPSPKGTRTLVRAYPVPEGELDPALPWQRAAEFRVDPGTGRFDGQLDPGRYAVRAIVAAGRRGREIRGSSSLVYVELEADQTDLHFEIGAGLSIEGHLVAESKGEAMGAEVHLLVPSLWGPRLLRTVKTDGDGAFRFDHLVPGTYWVEAHRMFPAGGAPVELRAGAPPKGLKVPLTPAGSRVVFTNVTQRPSDLPAGSLRLVDAEGRTAGAVPTWSQKHGCVQIGGLGPGTYTALQGHGDPIEACSPPLTIEDTNSEILAELSPLGPELQLGGMVTSPELGHVALRVVAKRAGAPIASAEVGADGRYRMTARGAGPTLIEVIQVAFPRVVAAREIRLSAGVEATADFDLPQGELLVALGSASPSTHARGHLRQVIVERIEGDAAFTVQSLHLRHGSLTRVPLLESGRYRVSFAGEGGARTEIRVVDGVSVEEALLPWPQD